MISVLTSDPAVMLCELSSGRVSVCPIDRQQQRRLAGLLLSALREEISIDSCGRRATGAPAVSSKCR